MSALRFRDHVRKAALRLSRTSRFYLRRARDRLRAAGRKLLERARAARLVWTDRAPADVRRRLLEAASRFLRSLEAESLKLKLTVGAIALAALILCITYSTLSHSSAVAARHEAQRRAVEMARFFSATVGEAVAAKDRMQVHVLARALIQSGVHATSITAADGEVLFASHTDPFYEPPGPKGTDPVATGEAGRRDLFQVTRPIHFGDAPVGWVRLWIHQSELERRMRQTNAYTYPIFALGFFLFIVLTLAVLHTPFRVLRRLTAVTERIRRGDLSERVPVHGRDEVATFCRSFNDMVEGLAEARSMIQRKHLETIEAMIRTVEAKDPYTQGHCIRVQKYAHRILERVEHISAEEKAKIETAALLHDVGKIGIPDRILFKKRQLSSAEMDIVRSHVTIGESILLHIDAMKDVATWVRHHHERWDGFGYPDGLRGPAIPFASRVIGVADAIDAMLTSRPYRSAGSAEEVVEALKEGAGKQFDAAIVRLAVSFLAEPSKQALEV